MSQKLQQVIDWMTKFKEDNKVKGVVLGLSGGKDSTVVAMLAKKVYGENVIAVLMPNGEQKDINDSLDIVKKLKLKHTIVNIGPTFDGLVLEIERLDKENPITVTAKSKTNIAPRLRMAALYGIAQSVGYLVIGTGNKSESMIGWTTKFGDSACDFNPIGHLVCTEVIEIGIELAKELGLPEKFIVKKPADGLTSKTDEDNFGFTYKELDDYL